MLHCQVLLVLLARSTIFMGPAPTTMLAAMISALRASPALRASMITTTGTSPTFRAAAAMQEMPDDLVKRSALLWGQDRLQLRCGIRDLSELCRHRGSMVGAEANHRGSIGVFFR